MIDDKCNLALARKVIDEAFTFVVRMRHSAVYIGGYDARLLYQSLDSLEASLNKYFLRVHEERYEKSLSSSDS